MSIVTFWNSRKEQTGKTLNIAAIATYMAIEHNYKILIISTAKEDKTLDNCFWHENKIKKNLGLFGPNTNTAMGEGIAGLIKVMNSNKLEPQSITNYTKIVFKERLEVLQTYKGNNEDYEQLSKSYPDIIKIANNYYDIILVDLDSKLDSNIANQILEMSNLNVVNLSQRLSSINEFLELREENTLLKTNKILLLIGRYDKFSKYTIKNITRYMNEKNKVSTIPYNTLFFEATEEAKVPDLFLKLRKKNTSDDDRNAFFISEVGRVVENIIYRLQDLQMKM